MNSLFIFLALGALLLIPTTNFAFAQVTDFYWSAGAPNKDIFTADAATTTVSQVTSGGFVRIDDVELDPLANKLWWNNWVVPPGATPTEGIYSSNVDGSGQVQVTTGTESNGANGFASGLHGIVLDPSNQVVFFTRGVSYANPALPFGTGGEVSRVNMDGSGYAMLNVQSDNWFPSGIERSGNTLYFGDPGVFVNTLGGAVNSMMTDGTAPVSNLVPHTDGHGRSLAYDSAKGLLFYSSFDVQSPSTGGNIFVYDVVNGGAAVNVLADPQTGIPDIELDTANMIIYWTDYARGEIRSASYDAAGNLSPPTTEISNLINPFGLALAFADEVVGGEFLPLDNTALLLAGLQSSAIWMLPVLAGVAGVGAFYIKSRINKD